MTAALPVEAAADRYIAAWQSLSADTIDVVDAMFTDDGRFSDPFNDLRGRDEIRASFARLYAMIAEVRIEVRDRAYSGRVCYMRWRFAYTLNSGRSFDIEGMSEVHLTDSGRASAHIDHWDAASQFYEKLPVIGWLLRRIKRRLQD